MWAGVWRPEEAIGFPGAGVAGGCELLEVHAQNTNSSPLQVQES